MSNLPTKPDNSDTDVDTVPTWQELRDRFGDLLKDFLKEGKEIERELEPRVVPILNRLKLELEQLIAKLEERGRQRRP